MIWIGRKFVENSYQNQHRNAELFIELWRNLLTANVGLFSPVVGGGEDERQAFQVVALPPVPPHFLLRKGEIAGERFSDPHRRY